MASNNKMEKWHFRSSATDLILSMHICSIQLSQLTFTFTKTCTWFSNEKEEKRNLTDEYKKSEENRRNSLEISEKSNRFDVILWQMNFVLVATSNLDELLSIFSHIYAETQTHATNRKQTVQSNRRCVEWRDDMENISTKMLYFVKMDSFYSRFSWELF